jgi:hypothetical protein
VSSPTLARTVSARSFLFGSGVGEDRAKRELGQSGAMRSIDAALGALASAGRHAAFDQIASSVYTLLDFDLMDLLSSGWQKYATLTAAARRTLADPATEEMVDLLAHRITSVQRPSVDVYVDEVKVGTLPLELEFDFLVESVVAEVRGGRLMALHHGQCLATGTLSTEEIELAHREGSLDLALTTGIGAGIPLLSREPEPPAEAAIVLPEL